ncbi:MAG: hypothetical protein RLZZ129_231 [Verrucomicrobiota bacterium]
MNHAQKLDQGFVAANPVADRVGKPREEETPDVAAPRTPDRGPLHDALDGGLDLIEKVPAVILPLLFEVTRGLNQFDLEGRVKPLFHGRAARALRKTSAWVMG